MKVASVFIMILLNNVAFAVMATSLDDDNDDDDDDEDENSESVNKLDPVGLAISSSYAPKMSDVERKLKHGSMPTPQHYENKILGNGIKLKNIGLPMKGGSYSIGIEGGDSVIRKLLNDASQQDAVPSNQQTGKLDNTNEPISSTLPVPQPNAGVATGEDPATEVPPVNKLINTDTINTHTLLDDHPDDEPDAMDRGSIPSVSKEQPSEETATDRETIPPNSEENKSYASNIISEMARKDGSARIFKEAGVDDELIHQLLKSFVNDDNTENFYHHGKHGSFSVINKADNPVDEDTENNEDEDDNEDDEDDNDDK